MQDGIVTVKYIASKENPADILTKAAQRHDHCTARDLMLTRAEGSYKGEMHFLRVGVCQYEVHIVYGLDIDWDTETVYPTS